MMGNGSSPLICNAELGTSGLNCSLPLLKAELGLNRLPSSGVLKVITINAGSQRDFRAPVRLAGHELLREEAAEGVYQYWLRKR